MATPMESPEQTVDKQSGFDRFLRYFLSLGTFGFGGPIATVGYMQRDLVEKRGWLAKQQFLNGIALGQTMPGSLAAQVAMWVGYLRRGALGALAVSLAFILPSFLLVLTVSFFYVRYQGLSWMQSLFYGIAPAVMAIIALAAVKLARLTDGTDTRLWAISLVVMAVSAITAKAGAFIFGSGLAIVPFLREGVVNQHPWLTHWKSSASDDTMSSLTRLAEDR